MSKQYCEKWQMANNNTSWLDSRTIANMDKIYDFLAPKTLCSLQLRKRRPRYTYNKLATLLGLQQKQIQFACQKLAFRKEPYLRIVATRIFTKKYMRVAETVQLIRFKKSEENIDSANTHAQED